MAILAEKKNRGTFHAAWDEKSFLKDFFCSGGSSYFRVGPFPLMLRRRFFFSVVRIRGWLTDGWRKTKEDLTFQRSSVPSVVPRRRRRPVVVILEEVLFSIFGSGLCYFSWWVPK